MRSHYAAARMSSWPAHVKRVDWGSVSRPSGYGPHEEQLIERHVTVKDITSGERVLTFEIHRRDDVAMKDQVANVRRVIRKRIDATIRELILDRVPISVFQSVRSILREDAHYVFARRRERIVVCRRYRDFDKRILRRPSGLGVLPRPINILH